MSISIGTRLGYYEVLAPLGAGGMGEVYRARDIKLGRDVALKILPAELANDADYMVRFQREDGSEDRVAAHGGFVHVKADGVSVLAPVGRETARRS